MPHRAPPNIGFRDLLHLNRRLHARGDADAFERILQGERVDDGREHAHVIGVRAVHAGRFVRFPAPDVAATDDDRDRNAEPRDFGDLLGHPSRRDVTSTEASSPANASPEIFKRTRSYEAPPYSPSANFE